MHCNALLKEVDHILTLNAECHYQSAKKQINCPASLCASILDSYEINQCFAVIIDTVLQN